MLRAQGSVSPTNKDQMFARFTNTGANHKSFPIKVPDNKIELLQIPTGTQKILIYSGGNPEKLTHVIRILFCGDAPFEDPGIDFFWNPIGHPGARLWEKESYPSKTKQKTLSSSLAR